MTFQSKESIQDVCVGAELNGEQRNEVMEVLRRYEKIFAEIPGKASVIEHKIDLTDNRPIRCKPYPLFYAKRGEIREEIKNMVDTEMVKESSSPYASRLVVVKKKDGSNRMCVDYRKFNLATIAGPAQMTTAEDLFGKLNKPSVLPSSSSSSSFNPVFPCVQRWPDAPHSFSNRSHSLSPSRAICSFLHSQPNLLYILFDLSLPCLLRSSSLSWSIHFKHHCLLQNALIIPPNHMSIPSYSIRFSHFI